MRYIVDEHAVRDKDSIIDRCQKSIPFEKRPGGQRVIELARRRILTALMVTSMNDIGTDLTHLLHGYGLKIYSLKGTDLELNKKKSLSIITPSEVEAFLSKPKTKKIIKVLGKNLPLRQIASECSCSVNLVRKVKKYYTKT